MLTQGDRNVVSNLRSQYGDRVAQYSDEEIAQAWRAFSQSDEYPDKEEKLFPDWCLMAKHGEL